MTAVVETEDIRKSYGDGEGQVAALRGISLRLDPAEVVALVGTSGAGKSTLLNMIGCIDTPTSGRVLIDGTDVRSLSEGARAQLRNRRIGRVFQDFNLLPVLSVFENVELPLLVRLGLSKHERAAMVRDALDDVGLVDLATRRPSRLSGGQRQRVAIARAIVGNPALVLADEPTANLDSESAKKVIDLLLSLNQKRGVTLLFSTHDPRLMESVQRFIELRDGAILREGKGSGLLTRDGRHAG